MARPMVGVFPESEIGNWGEDLVWYSRISAFIPYCFADEPALEKNKAATPRCKLATKGLSDKEDAPPCENVQEVDSRLLLIFEFVL